MSWQPIKFALVTNAKGKILNPIVHDDIDGMGLSPYEFVALAHSAHCSRRSEGCDRTSHATAARACSMSVRQVQRARTALVDKKLLVLGDTYRGKPATYKLAESLSWDRGCKMWMPVEVWDQALDPHAFRVYCHYICKAHGQEQVVADRMATTRTCCLVRPTLRKAEAALVSAGMLALVGRDSKHPVFRFVTHSEWVKPQERVSRTYAEVRSKAKKESSDKGISEEKKKAQTKVGTKKELPDQTSYQKKKPQAEKSNKPIKSPNSKRDVSRAKSQATRTQLFFGSLIGHDALAGFIYRLSRDGDPDQIMGNWLEELGIQGLCEGRHIIQNTTTSIDTNLIYKYAKNTRFINFCNGRFVPDDPPALVRLWHEKTNPPHFVVPPPLVSQPPLYQRPTRNERARRRVAERQIDMAK